MEKNRYLYTTRFLSDNKRIERRVFLIVGKHYSRYSTIRIGITYWNYSKILPTDEKTKGKIYLDSPIIKNLKPSFYD